MNDYPDCPAKVSITHTEWLLIQVCRKNQYGSVEAFMKSGKVCRIQTKESVLTDKPGHVEVEVS